MRMYRSAYYAATHMKMSECVRVQRERETETTTASVKASSGCELLAMEEEECRVQMEWNGMPSCANSSNNNSNFWNSFFCAFNL